MQLPAHRTLIPIFEELRGERVLLRPYREGDAEALFEAISESREHLLPWMPWSTQYQSLNDARHFVRLNASMWIARERLIVSMWDVGSGRFVGGCPCEVDWSLPSFEIGYWLRSSAESHGYVTDAVRLLTDYFFATYDAKRVFIRCDARNTRSAAVAERLGFIREARLRNYAIAHDGVLQDMLIYADTPEDWVARRSAS